jgi:hypothetical protein
MSHELAYPDGIYQYMFTVMLFIHPNPIYAGFYYGMYKCGIMGIVLCATSLNYWRYPLMNSTRRTVDMVVAKSAFVYHIYLSLYTPNKFITTLPIVLGASMYFISLYLEKKKFIKTAALCHCLIHLIASAGASLTYREYYLHNIC